MKRELETLTHELRTYAGDDGHWVTGPISAGVLREAADTITSLRNRMQELQGEVNHWRTEQVHAYGNWEDAYKRVIELEANNGTRWHELFGTPEKAARVVIALNTCRVVGCEDCAARQLCMPYSEFPHDDYDALLEWLRGDAE